MIKVIDLFCGCGGFSYGFEKNSKRIYKVVLAADNWNEAINNYKNYFQADNAKLIDLTKTNFVKKKYLRQFRNQADIVIGGPPCQPFSTLGKRCQLDQRLKLVFCFLDYVKYLNPKIFIMENVKGITMYDKNSNAKFSETAKKYFLDKTKNNYVCKDYLFNMVNIGMAQNRTRYFLVGINKSFNFNTQLAYSILEEKLFKKENKKVRTLKDSIGDLPNHCLYKNGSTYFENHIPLNHSENLIRRFSFIPPGGGLLDVPIRLLPKHLKRMRSEKYGSGGHVKNIYGRLQWDRPCGTIVAGIDKITCGRFVHPEYNRLLTPRECARLQSFPDEFTFKGSHVTQYYLIGNAVPPKFSEKVSKVLLKILNDQKS